MGFLKKPDQIVLKESWEYFRKLNRDIGKYWWKKYIVGAFWSNIAVPLNFSITLITAITTGEIASKTLIGAETALSLGITALILSTFNTFFSPEKKLGETKETMRMWTRYGVTLEEIRLKNISDGAKRQQRLRDYKKLFEKVNELKRQQSNDFITDLIHIIIKKMCIKEERWIRPRFLHPWEHDDQTFSLAFGRPLHEYMSEEVWVQFEEKYFDPESGLLCCSFEDSDG